MLITCSQSKGRSTFVTIGGCILCDIIITRFAVSHVKSIPVVVFVEFVPSKPFVFLLMLSRYTGCWLIWPMVNSARDSFHFNMR